MTRRRHTDAFESDLGVSPPGSGETGACLGDAEAAGLDSERPLGSAVPQEGPGRGGDTGEAGRPEAMAGRSPAAQKAAGWHGG